MDMAAVLRTRGLACALDDEVDGATGERVSLQTSVQPGRLPKVDITGVRCPQAGICKRRAARLRPLCRVPSRACMRAGGAEGRGAINALIKLVRAEARPARSTAAGSAAGAGGAAGGGEGGSDENGGDDGGSGMKPAATGEQSG